MYKRQFFFPLKIIQLKNERNLKHFQETYEKGEENKRKNVLKILFSKLFNVVLFVLLFFYIQENGFEHRHACRYLVNTVKNRNLSELLFKIKKSLFKTKKIKNKEISLTVKKKKEKKKKKKEFFKELKKLRDSFYTKNIHNKNIKSEVDNGHTETVSKEKTDTVVTSDLDDWEDIEEEELFKKIKGLSGVISVDEMYNVWNNVHAYIRKKYFYREEYIWKFFEGHALSYNISKDFKVMLWYKIYYIIKEEIMKIEKQEFSKIHYFINDNPVEYEVFIKFLFEKLDKWRKRMEQVEKKWMHLLLLNLRFCKRRCMILTNTPFEGSQRFGYFS
ncbi:Phist protein [Plasmodium gonderi]|uniref:Phist protein n=1 Tax=Plasmodium gonderi TaxID=77519 RepID=A0A1Y1JEU4_PLAGO|nr:Phist protein [Plasmodium gonderi]GAW79865.1 Phist protein [Plasmodium gonderi]